MSELHSSFMYTLAGIAMFLYGMTLVSGNLQNLAANRIQKLLTKISNNHFFGFLVGILLALLIQSSGAVTAMLVGLASAGVVTLTQVMSVILGAAVGTTFVVQLLSLKVAQFGMAIFTFSFIVYFLTARRSLKLSMSVLMGFGLIFWGLELIGVGTSVLKDVALFADLILFFKDNPMMTILATAFFTAVVHSSAVVIGFAISLAGTDLISLTDACYWVYGANIGTTVTALLASTGGNYMGKRVAWAHCFFKVTGVALFYFLTPYFVLVIETGVLERDIANTHTIFNILSAVLLFAFIPYGVKLIQKLITPSSKEKEFSVKFLRNVDRQNSSVALSQAEREVMRMGDIVLSMIKDSFLLFKKYDPDLAKSIRKRDDYLDLLNHEINLFVADCFENFDTIDERKWMRIMAVATDLESVGDVIDNSLREMALKKHNSKLYFSDEGLKELKNFHGLVYRNSVLAMSCFQVEDLVLAKKVIAKKRDIREIERKLRHSHMERLVAGKKQSISTSSIHLDILSELRRIIGLMSHQAYVLVKKQTGLNRLGDQFGDGSSKD